MQPKAPEPTTSKLGLKSSHQPVRKSRVLTMMGLSRLVMKMSTTSSTLFFQKRDPKSSKAGSGKFISEP